MKKIMIATLLILTLVALTACKSRSETVDTSQWEEYQYFDNDLSIADHLYVLEDDALQSYESRVTAQALQGIIAKTQSEIYLAINMGNHTPYKDYLDVITEQYGITYQVVESVYDLIDIFKDRISGYSLYTKNTDSVNIAQTYAGLRNVLPITEDEVSIIESMGLSFDMDMRDKDYTWLIDEFDDELNWDYVIQQNPASTGLRDYGVANTGLYIYNHYFALTAADFIKMGPDRPMLGWGSTDEVQDVSDLSYYGITTIATDHAYNLSIFGAEELHKESFTQKFDRSSIEKEDKHYVTFILSDGDNVQWMLNDYYQSELRYGSNDRGKIPFGWSIAPTMYDLAPTVLDQYYNTANTNDYLLPGVSGSAYFYPDRMPEEALELHVERTNEYFKRLDMEYLVIMGSRALDTNKSSLEVYANMSQIRGAFLYANFDRYMGYRGEVWWYNDKPFLSARNALWDTPDLQEFADMINEYEIDTDSINGYTVITVHSWSHSFADVMTVVNAFDDHVEVISPYHMMELVQENIPHTNAKPE